MKNLLVNYILTTIVLIAIPLLLYTIFTKYPGAGRLDGLSITGLILVIPSCILLVIARFQLGRSFSISAQAIELVTRGLYSKIRHPIYLFAQLMFIGLIFCIRNFLFFIPWFILLIIQIRRIKNEERVLEDKFGELYHEYKKNTWF